MSDSKMPPEADGAPAADEFDRSVNEFEAALGLLNQRQWEQAHAAFAKLAEVHPHEPHLAERARTYARICRRHFGDQRAEPKNAEERYREGVGLTNEGRYDDAIGLLTRALEDHPTSADYLYARASAYALKGNVEAAIGDLRQSIRHSAQYRFQAANDPDFEQIREEPAFIDIIEPTPTGA